MSTLSLSFIKRGYTNISDAQSASTSTQGAIIFDKTHKVICVNGDVYGGNVTDAQFTDNVLTISKADGSNVTLDFSDIASASSVMAVFDQLKDLVGITGSEKTLQGFYTTTTYLQGAQSVVQTAIALDSAIHGVQGYVETAQGYIQNVQSAVEVAQGAVEVAQGAVEVAQGAVEVAQGAIETLATDMVVTIDDNETTAGYLKTYRVKQGGSLIGSIDIPKDFLVKSASVIGVIEYPTGSGKYYNVNDTTHSHELPVTSAGKYIDFTINVKSGTATDDHIYVNVQDLCDVYTAEQHATQIQLAIDSSNVISATIVAGSVSADELKDNAVTTGKIEDGAVTDGKIATNAVTEDKIKNGVVTEGKIATNAVTKDKIADGAVTEGKIATNAVTEDKIADGAVTEGKIATNAVTEDKIKNGVVTEDKIADGAVTVNKLVAGFVTGGESNITVNGDATTLATVGGTEIKAQVHLYWDAWE